MDKQGYTIPEAARFLGIGRTSLYAAMRDGRLHPRKCGARTLLLRDDLERFLSQLPEAELPTAA